MQNGTTFSNKSSALRKNLKKAGFELVYPDGPLKLNPEDLPFSKDGVQKLGGESATDYRAWYDRNQDSYNLEPSFEAISRVVKDEGPFDGILGFSQGAAFAGLILNDFENLFSQKPLEFGIFYSGLKVKDPKYLNLYNIAGEIPTLHIMGEMDTAVEEWKSVEMLECFNPSNRLVMKHSGGHFVPHNKQFINQQISWLMKLGEEESHETDEDEELKKLSEELDSLGVF